MADIMSNGVYYDKNGNKLEVVDAAARAGVAENKQEIDVLSEAMGELSEEIAELKGGSNVVVTSKGKVINVTVDDGETIAVTGDTEAEVTLVCQGKNFVPEFPAYNKNGLVGTQNEDGSYTLKGTYTGTSKAYIAAIPNTAARYLPAGTYTISSSLAQESGITRPVVGFPSDASQKQAFWAGTPQQFTLEESATFYCFVEIAPGAVVDATFWVQMERGEENTAYEVHRREEVVGNLPIELSPPAGENVLYTETGDTLTVNQTKAGGSVIQTDNPLKGKTIAFLGDSITTTYYAHNYWQMIAEKTGCIPLGYGVSKSRIATVDGDDVESFVTRAAAMDKSADAVLVMGGTNDVGLYTLLGEWSSEDVSTFYGALNALIALLRTNYPGKPIIFCTPIKRKYDTDNGFPDTMADLKAASATEQITMQHCVLAIKAKCARHGIPVIDLAEHSGFSPETPEYYYSDSDNLHPSELGYVRIANMVQTELEKQFLHAIKVAEGTEQETYTPDIQGYVNTDGTIRDTGSSKRTDYLALDGVTRIVAQYRITNTGYALAYFDADKNLLTDVSIVGAGTDKDYTIDTTPPANAAYCIFSHYPGSDGNYVGWVTLYS